MTLIKKIGCFEYHKIGKQRMYFICSRFFYLRIIELNWTLNIQWLIGK